MKCRPGCAACCVYIEISSPLPGYPDGKPAGVRCLNLNDKDLCTIWDTPAYPAVCREFTANAEFCGKTNEEAVKILTDIERLTKPEEKHETLLH